MPKLKILEYLTTLADGELISYKLLGDRFNLHPRLVANLLASNQQQDKYPCYKVINHDGRLGGYNLGVEEKVRRLKNDGVKIKNGKISDSYFFHLRN